MPADNFPAAALDEAKRIVSLSPMPEDGPERIEALAAKAGPDWAFLFGDLASAAALALEVQRQS